MLFFYFLFIASGCMIVVYFVRNCQTVIQSGFYVGLCITFIAAVKNYHKPCGLKQHKVTYLLALEARNPQAVLDRGESRC